MMRSRWLAVGRALLVAALGGAALSVLGLILMLLAIGESGLPPINFAADFGASGAAAGCITVGLLWIERRWFASRIPTLIAGLLTYYVGVIVCWGVLLAAQGTRRTAADGGAFSEWLNELMKGLPSILSVATIPIGLITIPLCFLLRAWLIRICDPRPAPADMLHE
jgi:hypothetical protein